MPLYEALIVTRAGPAKQSQTFLKGLIWAMFDTHPTVRIRDVQNLGDRAMGKYVVKEDLRHQAGRYLQILYDGSPEVKRTIEKRVFTSKEHEVIRLYVHRIKDYEYINHMYMKCMRNTATVGVDDSTRNLAFVRDFNRFDMGA